MKICVDKINYINYIGGMKTDKKQIKNILKAKGLTLGVLAERMHLESAQAAYYRLYSAKKLSTIKAIAKALRVGVKEIMG